MRAVDMFQNNWRMHNEAKPPLTEAQALEAGADPTVKSRSGTAAIEIARKEARVFKTRA